MARFKRGLLSALLAALLLAMIIPTASAAGIDAYINRSTKVYAAPTKSSMSMNVPANMPVTFTAMNGGWAQVMNGSATAYIPLEYITLADGMKGYICKETKIYESASRSSTSAGPLPVNTPLYVIGVEDGFWRVKNDNGSVVGYVPCDCASPNRVSQPSAPSADPRDYVVAMDWFDGGNKVLARGEYGTIYDIESGVFFNIKRMGGTNHADIEPATLEDTMKLYTICDGEYSWDSRPVILIANGKFVACAMNTMPHGDETIYDNGYDGQCCLHMVNSRTHGSDKVNQSHQEAIREAYNWAH